MSSDEEKPVADAECGGAEEAASITYRVPSFAVEARSLARRLPVSGGAWYNGVSREVNSAEDDDLGILLAGFAALQAEDLSRFFSRGEQRAERGFHEAVVSQAPVDAPAPSRFSVELQQPREDEGDWRSLCSRDSFRWGAIGGGLFGLLLSWGYGWADVLGVALMTAFVGAVGSFLASLGVVAFSPFGRMYSRREAVTKCVWYGIWALFVCGAVLGEMRWG